MLHIYSGNGKGKTTAGFGLVLRQAGYERRVAVAQFLKDGTSGELRALQALSCVKVRATQMPQGFYFQMQEQEQLATRQGIQELFAWVKDRAKEKAKLGHLPASLDEVLDAVQLGLLREEELLHFLQEHWDLEIILTGRNPSQELLDICDYHTEMVEHRHPYQKGIAARKGVEY